ncbi:MAG: GTPase Era [Gammaproteobacteria bacterium]|nr:GTPase Era [Gammaproteobacteria bacterium]MCP4088790.1 GTPase Era [Gammaproteobacteria bacterium]MCP4275911.1 GTPase Era [Gammaproteobacteria bacterium]MCP4832127.1 GTPase Era [Gammaproteobacteria bacterium]MCP4928272.1 GTPase Era [Gammaproteobacteria bacterium]
MSKSKHRSGFVAVVGKPNVGKSTLINSLIGHKISIVTSKPHTTRHAILGVLTKPEAQVVFIDTPGLENKSRRLMNRAMNRAAVGAIEGANLILFVIEAGKWNSGDTLALELIKQTDIPCILVINKIDEIKPKERLLPYLQESSVRYDFTELVPISALREENLQRLLETLVKYLPEENPLYPAEMLTDRGLRFQAAEVIREKLMESLYQEVPYGLAVEINELGEDERGLLRIDAIIWVDRESHKGIVVGKGGHSLKKVGQAARLDLESRLGRPLHLETKVKLKRNWADNAQALKQMGYDGDI